MHINPVSFTLCEIPPVKSSLGFFFFWWKIKSQEKLAAQAWEMTTFGNRQGIPRFEDSLVVLNFCFYGCSHKEGRTGTSLGDTKAKLPKILKTLLIFKILDAFWCWIDVDFRNKFKIIDGEYSLDLGDSIFWKSSKLDIENLWEFCITKHGNSYSREKSDGNTRSIHHRTCPKCHPDLSIKDQSFFF